MIKVVTTKFHFTFWRNFILMTVFVFILTLYFSLGLFVYWRMKFNEGLIKSIVTMSVLLVLYYYFFIKSLKTLTVAPEGIIIKTLFTNEQTAIGYDDIIHVGNYVDRRSPSSFYGKYLLIELKDGKSFHFRDNHIANYVELKDALREYRFHLNHEDHNLD